MVAEVRVGDFFSEEPRGLYDVVIGNPPFVRYQEFSGESRARSRQAALKAGVPLSNLASSWAAFTVHSALFLRKGGRLGLVLPAELLTVNYAAPIRRFLLENFTSVDLVLFEYRVFPEVLEEVVLLVAEGYKLGSSDHFRVCQSVDANDLDRLPLPRSWKPTDLDAKWTPSLLPAEALSVYGTLMADSAFSGLQAWGETTLGMVTGNNRFFALSPERVSALGLKASDLIRLSPPGSRHLRGLTLTDAMMQELGASGQATFLFRPSGEPSPAGYRYIEAGHETGVDQAYKCRIRGRDWWRVPLLAPADILLTYMNADTPRLCTNQAAVHHLNSVHGVYVKPGLRKIATSLLPLASINTMTFLGAETVGRAYGGGMLKIEPREADALPVPSVELVKAASRGLQSVRRRVVRSVRVGELRKAADLVDEVLLLGELGMRRSEVDALKEAHRAMAARRTTRGGKARG